MKTWTTLLATDNYLNAVLILEKSRQVVNSKYPLTVICYDTLSLETFQTLDKYNIAYQIFPEITFSNIGVIEKYKVTCGKFYVYCLKNISTFCFIDADSCFIQNIDYLLDIPTACFFFYDASTKNNINDINKIVGCIFKDQVSNKRFEQAMSFISDCTEDEQILPILANNIYGLRISYKAWTLQHMVLLHGNSEIENYDLWNKPNFSVNSYVYKTIDSYKQNNYCCI